MTIYVSKQTHLYLEEENIKEQKNIFENKILEKLKKLFC